MKIQKVIAREILDSRGNPTISTRVYLQDGSTGTAAVPSGASTGKYEAVELRDHDPKRYNGLGVLTAVTNVNEKISGTLTGMDAEKQDQIDQRLRELDGTENKAKLGANAILSVSMATAKAQSVSEKKPLYEYLTKFNPKHTVPYVMPIPMMNIMNGAKHANWATDIQEYMILPLKTTKITEGIRMCAETYYCLKQELKALGYSTNVGDEGGFAPRVSSNEEPFKLIHQAITKAGYQTGLDIVMGIDAAASEFFKDGTYRLNKEGKTMTSEELSRFYLSLRQTYPIMTIEDPFDEDDWSGFQTFTARSAGKFQIVGDDLYVTSSNRIQKGIEQKATNSVLIKLNQIGTVTETVRAVLLARQNNMTAVVSHRSGETEDTFIADFVVAMGTGQIKTGAPARGERTAKYNRLMEIELELGENATYGQFPFFSL